MFTVLDKEKNTELHTLDLGGVNLSAVDPDDVVFISFTKKTKKFTKKS